MRVFKPSSSRWTKELSQFSLRLHKTFISRGALNGVLYIKGTRSALQNYLAGSSIRVKGVKVSKDGIPLVLGDLIAAIRSDATAREILPVVMTIQYATRALSLGRAQDTSSITDDRRAVSVFDGRYLKSFWRDLGYKPSQIVPNRVLWKKFHFTTKNGPNGHALGKSLLDLSSIPEVILENIKTFGGKEISNRIEQIMSNSDIVPGFSKEKQGLFRRLSWFGDKESKVRVIGVVDYWSQTVLRPFHYYLNSILRKIPQDCTFDQGSFKAKIAGWNTYHSIDLTAATDRFPIVAICLQLEAKFPKFWVSAWRSIMVDGPFRIRSLETEVSYKVGNPMGAYSSWPSFALTHHFLLYHSCKVIGIEWKTAPYVLLGDDIVIGDDKLKEIYLSLISELGQEFSKEKTYSSPHFLEFAKRLFYKGEEITPFPISALREESRRFYLLTNFFMEQEVKGWVSELGIPAQVSSFYRNFFGYNSKRAKEIQEKSLITNLMMKVIRGVDPASSIIHYIARQTKFPYINKLSDEVCDNILSNIAVEAFSKSNPENDKDKSKGYPLGQLAENLLIHFTGQIETRPSAIELIYAYPILGAYGQIEEMYMDQKKQALRVDRTGERWPMLLRVMALPLDDRVFIQRTSHVIPKAATFIGKLLEERQEILKQYPNLF